ncbi:hypothetical protein [Jannaschia donghaensis]|uniref:Uncharacterized protein n=1 Tax=Jannaschia donghaensis TaxID=420998 RepID=A0A0M6YGI4_9RHOB|nr:hypothetical protein [Jannaschia donghaensis]CTQ49044.1 hypothetical protein JDO7802_01053 [Jannaschia donghaensis]
MNLDRIFVGCAWAWVAGTVFFWIAATFVDGAVAFELLPGLAIIGTTLSAWDTMAAGLVAVAIMSIWLSVSLTDAALISVGPGPSVAIGWSAVFGAGASFDFGLDRAE